MMRRMILPGDLIFEKPMRMNNAYISGGKTLSKVLGIFDDVRNSLIRLEGVWKPFIGNNIVGVVSSVSRNVCSIYLNYTVNGILIVGRNSRYNPVVGDIIESTVINIEKRNVVVMDRARPIKGGRIIKVKSSKIPRVVGKSDSMVRQIEELTGTRINVGLNGLVYINGKGTENAIKAIRTIEKNAHTQGLTDRIKEMLTSV